MMKKLLFLGRDDVLSKALLERFETDGFSCQHLVKDAEAYKAISDLEHALSTEQQDVLVVYPPYQGRGRFLDSTASAWEEALSQNVEATTYILQAALKSFSTSSSGGRIIVLNHVSALAPLQGLSLMGTTLSALNALVKMLALELAPHDATVNSVAVGPLAAGLELSQQANERLEQDTPLATDAFEAAADLCLFMCSDSARHLTGQVLRADGGFLLTRGSGVSPYTQ